MISCERVEFGRYRIAYRRVFSLQPAT